MDTPPRSSPGETGAPSGPRGRYLTQAEAVAIEAQMKRLPAVKHALASPEREGGWSVRLYDKRLKDFKTFFYPGDFEQWLAGRDQLNAQVHAEAAALQPLQKRQRAERQVLEKRWVKSKWTIGGSSKGFVCRGCGAFSDYRRGEWFELWNHRAHSSYECPAYVAARDLHSRHSQELRDASEH